jgi:hypothetical protein
MVEATSPILSTQARLSAAISSPSASGSYETVINLIGAARTTTGLRVKAKLDTRFYEAGVKITDEEMEQIKLRAHRTNPEWNYTISPSRSHG